MADLILLIGLPGSGKSSLAQQWCILNREVQWISTDRIRAQLFGDETVQGPWLRVWNEVHRQFCRAVVAIEAGQCPFAIYDATNAERKQRRDAIALARGTGFTQITGIWLNPPLAVCLERNHQRDRNVPELVILRMHRELISAPPTLTDGLDHLIRWGTD